MVQSWRVNGANSDTLRDLMVAYQRGDLEAFDRLYVALEPELRGFLVSHGVAVLLTAIVGCAVAIAIDVMKR